MKPGEIAEDQSAAIALLQAEAGREGKAERIDTHGAIVFLAGETAWKLKRAVWYPFLDFTTPDKRRAACEAEIRLNRRTAPEIYLACRPIARQPNGSLELGGNGEAVDWVVVMRRFDQDMLFDRMAERGTLTRQHIVDLADAVADFHGTADPRPDHGGAEAIRWVLEDNIEEMAAMPDCFGRAALDRLSQLSKEALDRNAALLDDRRDAGFVRHCHGDLHLRNIFLWQGKPTLFDCLEFDERLACIDVLYDLAFLLMDLQYRNRGEFANLALNRYLQRTGDLDGLAALPLFLSCRAAIRAKVLANGAAMQDEEALAAEMRTEARNYLSLAISFLQTRKRILVGIGGESGSGKSTVAAAVASGLGGPAGGIVLRSDVNRKRLFGKAMEEPLPEEAYSREATERTYASLIDDARTVLGAGFPAIADAVYADPAERNALEAAGREMDAPFRGFWIDVPLEIRIERVTGRRADASDASADFLRAHPVREKGPMEWQRIDGTGGMQDVADGILEAL